MARVAARGRAVAGARAAVVLLVPLSLVACSDDEGRSPTAAAERGAVSTTSTSAEPTTTTLAAGPDQATLDGVRVQLEQVVAADQPTSVATRPGDEALYWTEVKGAVWSKAGSGDPQLVLDLRGEVGLRGEQGMFSLDFSPDGRLLYLSFSDLDGRNRIVELAMRGRVADRDTWRDVLVVDQPEPIHNGGHIHVGPDGLLWASVGDGGKRFDPDGNAQSLGTLLGKLLRIDPRGGDGTAYTIPEGNPFAGDPAARPEIWSYGLRNPWRFAVDHPTGDVWVADVGQYVIEEVTYLAGGGAGANLGWAAREGSLAVRGRPAPPGAVFPIVEYNHDDGRCAVAGGYVYRGDAIPGLAGAYLYGDLCDGRVRALSQRGGEVVGERDLGLVAPQLVSILPDHDGEPLVVSLAGAIHRLVPAP